MQISYDDLKTFIAVVDTGSYSKAAQLLGITRTTIARRISKLEELTGDRLVIINTYKFKITESGTQFYNLVVEKFKSFDVTMDEISQRYSCNKEVAGDLRVQLPPMLAMYKISPKIPRFLHDNPKLNLAIFYSKDFEVDLVKNELDVAVVNHLPSKPDQKVKKIFSYSLGLFCTAEYKKNYGVPESIDELREHLIVGHTKENYKLEKYVVLTDKDNNKQIKVAMPRRLMGNSENNTLSFLYSNEAIVPLFIPNDEYTQSRNLIRVLPNWIIKDFHNYYMLTNQFSNELNVRVFTKFIQDCLSK